MAEKIAGYREMGTKGGNMTREDGGERGMKRGIHHAKKQIENSKKVRVEQKLYNLLMGSQMDKLFF